MSKITNKKAVREYALLLAGEHYTGRTRVSEKFLHAVEVMTQKQIENRVLYHENIAGSRKTLV